MTKRAAGRLSVLAAPTDECLRSLARRIRLRHFTACLGSCYPAYGTALPRMDFVRMCEEAGFEPPVFSYPDDGAAPKLPRLRWRTVSLGLLRGRLFSDTVVLHTRRRR